ncbi:MAG: hypothetical protein R8K54_00060 [Mariprofundaceae bacterium]
MNEKAPAKAEGFDVPMQLCLLQLIKVTESLFVSRGHQSSDACSALEAMRSQL